MKSMKPNKMRDLNPGEIESKLADSREELMKLRFQAVSGQLTDTSHLRILRRKSLAWRPSSASSPRLKMQKVKHEQSSSHDWFRYQQQNAKDGRGGDHPGLPPPVVPQGRSLQQACEGSR